MDYQNFDLVVQVRDAASRTYSVLANGEADVAAMDTFSLQANWETLQALADRVGRQATLARSAAGAATAEQVMVIQSDTVPSDAGLSLETVADLPALPGGVRSFAPQIEGWEGEEAAILLARELGQQLHHAVFTEKVQTALRSARAALPPGVGLRFRLRLEGAPELHRLPWEYLHDGEDFLALQAGVPVVRHVEEVTPTEPLQVSGALRLLVVVSAPSDQAVLDVEGEVARLKAVLEESVAAGRLEVDVLEDGRWSTLEAALTPGEGRPAYHILHFIGHGTADAGGGGRLYFEGEDGTAVAQDAEGLTALLVNHPSLRLVVLNACQGATSDELDARSSIAARLVGRPAPAVVAMQYAITDRAALDFSRAFYGALAMGNPVDTALALARAAEFRRLADGESPRGVEWGTPVLYLRARDGRLFAPAARAARFGPRIGLAVALALLGLGTAGALATRTPYYQDGDRDGYGAGEPVKGWSAEDGWVARAGDCDDENRSINPDAVEQCDAVDHDCDGNPHNGVDVPRWFPDSDGDGHGDRGAEAVEACGQPKGFVASRDDCDDRDASTHPGAQEQCDDVDHDCQGGPTNGVTYSDWFRDADGDGFGAGAPRSECRPPDGFVARSGDCNDAARAVHPGAAEQCDGVDQDCDGKVDEATVTRPWYRDADGDGLGHAGVVQQACRAPAGYVERGGDCNDGDSSLISLNACGQCAKLPVEVCNAVDDDCDGKVDEGRPGGGSNDWKTGPKADGSYDHNCDGRAEKESTADGGICRCKKSFMGTPLMEGEDKTPGWVKGVPECGKVGTWGKTCNYQRSAARCEWRTEERRQGCR